MSITTPFDLFTFLPTEIVVLVFKWLKPEELGRVSQVCKRWKNISEDNSIWIDFCQGHNFKESNISFKRYYVNHIRSWLKGVFKKYTLLNQHGTYHICEIFDNSLLITGTRSDYNEEWDLKKKKSVNIYEVPTGPASDYRMTQDYLLIKTGKLRLWKRNSPYSNKMSLFRSMCSQ